MQNHAIHITYPSTGEYLPILTAKNISQLKKKAKNLAKDRSVQHSQALDIVARDFGASNWKAIMRLYDDVRPTEDALKTGYAIAMDIKDALNTGDDTRYFVRGDLIFPLMYDQLLSAYQSYTYEDDEIQAGKSYGDVMDEDELMEGFRDFINDNVFYLLKTEHSPANRAELVQWSYQDFMPGVAWFGFKEAQYVDLRP